MTLANHACKMGIGVWLVAFLGVALCYFHGPHEPVFDDKPLTRWLRACPEFFIEAEDKASESGRAAVAVRHIGTNALPYLMRLVQTRESPLKRTIDSTLPSFWPARWRFRPAWENGEMGAFGFYALGPVGKDAVPALIELLQDNDAGVQSHAARSLGFIGPDAEPAIPGLLALLNHPNRVVTWSAIESLGEIHRQPSVVVPALIANLLSTNQMRNGRTTIAVLGDIGQEAKEAIPFILPFLNETDELTQLWASNALFEIEVGTGCRYGRNSNPLALGKARR